MEVKKGKLVNLKTKGELPFSINPTEFQISHQFEYTVESRLGKASSLVGYRSAGPAKLAFAIHFDKDVDDKSTPQKVESFLKGIGEIDDSTKSVPKVEFRLGETSFKGYAKAYRYIASRFDNKGEVASVRLELEILSDGSYEEGEGR